MSEVFQDNKHQESNSLEFGELSNENEKQEFPLKTGMKACPGRIPLRVHDQRLWTCALARLPHPHARTQV